jgi:hypothetical protein
MPRTPFDPRTGKYLAFGEGIPVSLYAFVVAEIGADVLVCTDREGLSVLVAKPRHLRKSTFNGETIDGKTYTSTGTSSRSAVLPLFPDRAYFSETHEEYVVGETIFAFSHHEHEQASLSVTDADGLTDVPVGAHTIQWEDANLAGRRWSTGDHAEFTLVAEEDNRLEVTDANGSTTYIAKPPRLRVATYDGETIDGVTYTSTAADARTASDGVADDEDQLITPSYYVGETICARRSSYVDPDDSFPYWWEEIGEGREWAVEA